MFAGIVETKALMINTQRKSSGLQLTVEYPPCFEDLKKGDSLAVDGVCLTVESLSDKGLSFILGKETLEVCSWFSRKWEKHVFNLERSLRVGDRIHGHYLTGHVDGLGRLVSKNEKSSGWIFEFSRQLKPYIWTKGSIALNGVSLTVNKVKKRKSLLAVHLIPETLRRTNLCHLEVGDIVHMEADYMAKAIYHYLAGNRKYIAQNKSIERISIG